MNRPLARRNYDGVFVQQIGQRRETWRIIHRMRDGRMTERLISTDGSGREFVRNGSEAVWYFPDRKVVLVEDRARASGYITALYGVDADTEKYYQLRSSDQPVRVRGFMARLVTVEPRDSLRYGYRYWIDEKTSMPVRTQLVAATGEVIAEISFISMSLPDVVDEELLKPDVDTTGFRWLRRDPPALPGTVRTNFVARPELLPTGFRVKTFPNMPVAADRGPRTRFIISDAGMGFGVHRGRRQRPTGNPAPLRGAGADGHDRRLQPVDRRPPHHSRRRCPGGYRAGHRQRHPARIAGALVLLGRPGCGLCEEMLEELQRLAAAGGAAATHRRIRRGRRPAAVASPWARYSGAAAGWRRGLSPPAGPPWNCCGLLRPR
ncbi:MAG: sigma-E factor regulatory protein RseB domain-containing protein [Steroidobacteraceae bacterium]